MKYLDRTTIDKELLLRFFLYFSRFEFSLKAEGFLQKEPVRRCKKARDKQFIAALTDWDCFAASLKNRFDKSANTRLLRACDYILSDPPRKQVVVHRILSWKTQSQSPKDPEPEVKFLLKMVRCVRNNLFHGGTHNVSLHEDEKRTKKLLESSLVILEECLKLSPDVKRAFDDAEI